MKIRFLSPIAFSWGTLNTNYHGEDGAPLRNQWSCVKIVRGVRFYRYFVLGDCVHFDLQLRQQWWKVLRVYR